jgi:hypothetical protein
MSDFKKMLEDADIEYKAAAIAAPKVYDIFKAAEAIFNSLFSEKARGNMSQIEIYKICSDIYLHIRKQEGFDAQMLAYDLIKNSVGKDHDGGVGENPPPHTGDINSN